MATQTIITFPPLPTVTFGSPDVVPAATSNSPEPIKYTTANPMVASVINGKLHLVSPGVAQITASQLANADYTDATAVQTLTVLAQTITTPQPGYPAGLWWMDSADLFQTYSMIINEGTADALRLPPRKAPLTHDWPDKNGIDVDLSKVYFKERRILLEMSILAHSKKEFFDKRAMFLATLAQPGSRRFEFASHGNRSYYLYYEDNNSWKMVTKVPVPDNSGLIAHKFSITLVEPEPKIDATMVFIRTDDGRLLIA